MSPLVTERIAFTIILLTTSQMPIGRTPGFLSSAIRLQDVNGARPSGSTKSLQIRRVRSARELHRSLEADLKDEHNLLHPLASTPDGPAAPLVWSVAE